MQKAILEQTLNRSLRWFRCSSVMTPDSGFWGVAERIYLCPDEQLKESVLNSFNSYTSRGTWTVIESRRTDCNFQTAYLFLLASVLKKKGCRQIAENILDFLYFRSGLLNRAKYAGIEGVWNWSHTSWAMRLWMDDNSWALLIPLLIARMEPALAERYQMLPLAEKLAQELAAGFERTFHAALQQKDEDDMSDPEGVWNGRPLHPHWGSLCCCALAEACRSGFPGSAKYAELIREYHTYLAEHVNSQNASELAYALLGATAAFTAFKDPFYKELAVVFGEKILAKADPETGNVPAEHYEAPCGRHLVDTIYTANWVLLSFQNLIRIVPERKDFRTHFKRMLKLFVDIQDFSPEPQFNGCWRGMYDMTAKKWGGGHCREGGSGSIYTGWTNAPAAIVFAQELLKTSLFDFSIESISKVIDGMI